MKSKAGVQRERKAWAAWDRLVLITPQPLCSQAPPTTDIQFVIGGTTRSLLLVPEWEHGHPELPLCSHTACRARHRRSRSDLPEVQCIHFGAGNLTGLA